MVKITPEYLAKKGKEHDHQSAFFCRLSELRKTYPELGWMHAIPNGGDRNRLVAANMVKEGARKGVLDTMLPVARGSYHGLYIEFKHPKYEYVEGHNLSPKQLAFGDFVSAQDYKAEIAFTWQQAEQIVLDYLNLGAFKIN